MRAAAEQAGPERRHQPARREARRSAVVFPVAVRAHPRAARAHRPAALADRRRSAPRDAGELAADRPDSAGASRRRARWSACRRTWSRLRCCARWIRSSCSATGRARCCASSPTRIACAPVDDAPEALEARHGAAVEQGRGRCSRRCCAWSRAAPSGAGTCANMPKASCRRTAASISAGPRESSTCARTT